MKKQILLYVSALFLVFTACEDRAVEPAMQAETNEMNSRKVKNFRAHLTGDQEVPAVETNATGQAIFQLSKDGTQLSYKLIVANIEDVRMAHLHLAPAGMNGGVAAWLYPMGPPPVTIPGTYNGTLSQGVLTTADLRGALAGKTIGDLVDQILAGKVYVNVHTMQFGGGEIRGQIMGNDSQDSL